MPLPDSARIYVDTMVWVRALLEHSHQDHAQAALLLHDLEAGRLIGIATTFVIDEYVGVAQRLLAKANHREPTPSEVRRAETLLAQTLDSFGIELYDSDEISAELGGLSSIFKEGATIIRQARPTQGRDGKWRSVGGADGLHIAFAERTAADFLATSDEGFRNMGSNVRPAILQDVYP